MATRYSTRNSIVGFLHETMSHVSRGRPASGAVVFLHVYALGCSTSMLREREVIGALFLSPLHAMPPLWLGLS